MTIKSVFDDLELELAWPRSEQKKQLPSAQPTPDKNIDKTVFDDLEISTRQPAQPTADKNIDKTVFDDWEISIGRQQPQQFRNLFLHPIKASKLAIGEQYQYSAKMFTESLPEALKTSPVSNLYKAKAALGALGMITAPLTPAFSLLENTGRTVALAFLQNKLPGLYRALVDKGWVNPVSNSINFKNIGVLSGKDRPTTGSAVIDFLSDIAAGLVPLGPPGVKLARQAQRAKLSKIEKTLVEHADEIRNAAKEGKAVPESLPAEPVPEAITPPARPIAEAEDVAAKLPEHEVEMAALTTGETPPPPPPPRGTVGSVLAEAERITQAEPKKPTLWEKLKAAPRKVQTSVISEFTPLRLLEREVLKIAGKPVPPVDIARKFEQVSGAWAKAQADVRKFKNLVVDPIVDIADDFNTYLFLRRTLSRLEADPVRKKVGNWDIEKTQIGIKQLEDKIGSQNMARLERVSKVYQQLMDDALALQLVAQRISYNTYLEIKKSNDFYAPFKVLKYLDETETAPGAGRSVATTEDLTKAIRGIEEEDLKLGNILQASVEQIQRSRILAEKNMKMLELDKLVGVPGAEELISRAQPTRYYRIESNTAAEILDQLAMQQMGRPPQLMEQSFIKVGKAIQYAEDVGLKVDRNRLMKKALGRAHLGGIDMPAGTAKIQLRAFTSDVITHELGHAFDVNVGGTKMRLSHAINNPKAINPSTGKPFSKAEFDREFENLLSYTRIGGPPKYRARATERFAEFIQLYIHNPKKARELAPTWTEYFELNILPNHRVKELVENLSEFFQKVDALPNIMTPLQQLDGADYLSLAIKKAFPDKAPQIGVKFGTKPKPGNEIVTYFKEGKEVALEVSKDVATAIQGATAAQTDLIFRALAVAKAPLQWGATTANLAFQVVNLLFSDVPRFALMSRYGIRNIEDVYRFPIDWIYSLYTAMTGNFGKWNDLYWQFLRSGAPNSTIQRGITPDVFKVRLGLPEGGTLLAKAARIPDRLILDNIAKFSNAIEESTKILALKRGMRMEGLEVKDLIKDLEGATPDDIKRVMEYIVAEVRNYGGSPDFLRKGKDTQRLNLLFMFFNPAVQATSSDLARLIGKTGSKEARDARIRMILGFALPVTTLALVNKFGPDKEEYKKISQREKDNYLMIPAPGDRWIINEDGERIREYYRIPKRGIFKPMANIIEAAVDFAAEHEPEAAFRIAEALTEDLSPINIEGKVPLERLESILSSTNPLIKVGPELVTGRDFWWHSDVIPQYLKGAPPEEQYKLSTPGFYVTVGKALGVSPLRIEMLVRSITGGALSQFAYREPPIGRTPLSAMPVMRRFYRSGVTEFPMEEKAYTETKQEQVAEQVRRRREAQRIVREWEKQKLSKKQIREQMASIRKADPKLADRIRQLQLEHEREMVYEDRRLLSLGVDSGARADYIVRMLNTMDDKDDRNQYLQELRRKKILTPKVFAQVRKKLKEKKQ